MRHKLKFFAQLDHGNELDLNQYLDFVEREPRTEGKALVTIRNGTTVREVIAACIRELDVLNETIPCPQNVVAIKALESALHALHEREADRRGRGVEGFHLP